MNLHTISPLSDSRWDELVARHPRASVFHERGWLEALSRTYGYQPFSLTSAAAGKPLSDGIVLCRVSSWITGTRLVSLPFSDHCDPLLNDVGEFTEFVNWLRAECDRQQCKYVELRPLSWNVDSESQMLRSGSYYFHSLDLAASLQDIFCRLHKDSIQRRIRRAERAELTYQAGCSRELLDEFYHLHLRTRRRHHLIPQPRTWFRNLMECIGDKMRIRVARKANVPVAALLTLRHRSSVVYKYGCSDERFHGLGGMPFLFWRLIEESKASGGESIDFGRSDVDDVGLVTFKDRFGTSKKLLRYFRYSPAGKQETATSWGAPAIRRLFSILPNALLPSAGRILYRHIG